MAKIAIKKKVKKKLVDKKEVVKSIEEKLGSAKSIILSGYRGLNVHEISTLRKNLREQGIEFKVLKNNLVRIAARNSGLEGLEDFLAGPVAYAFGYEDPIMPAKALNRFSREHEFLTIKGGVVEGRIIDAAAVRELALIPSREELIAKIAGTLNAPLNNLLYVLNAPLQGLVTVLGAVADQKQAVK